MSLSAHSDSDKLRFIVQHPGTLGTVLYTVAIRYLGPEIHNFEPETVEMEMRDELGFDLPPVNHDKLMAIINSVGTNAFYRDPMAFFAVSQLLSGSPDPFDMTDPLLPAEMAWAVAEVQLNDDTPEKFSPDVAALVGSVLNDDGFVQPPGILGFAKMPYRYTGSDTQADLNQQKNASTEHAKVVNDYVKEQALLLYKQLSGLPWQTTELLSEISSDLLGVVS